jgi:hypothetical protein
MTPQRHPAEMQLERDMTGVRFDRLVTASTTEVLVTAVNRAT